MRGARSSVHGDPGPKPGDAVLIAEIRAATGEVEGHGCRRADAGNRHRRMVVAPKTVRRRRKENGLAPSRRRSARMTDSDNGAPVFPLIAKEA